MNIESRYFYMEKYNAAFLEVRQIINDIDPIGLIEWCGPEEYDPEVADIVAKLKDCMSPEEAKEMVIQVFTKWFDDPGNLDFYENIGPKLMDAKKLIYSIDISEDK